MQDLTPLIILGFMLSFLFQLSANCRVWKVEILLIFSVISLTIISSISFTLIIIAWISLVYILALCLANGYFKKFNLPLFYSVVVILIFFAFRLNWLHVKKTQLLGGIGIPIGFSFIMFQSIVFLKDFSQGNILKIPNCKIYFTSSLYFPTLTMGPFCSTQYHIEQLERINPPPWDFFYGYCWFSLGLFKFGISSFLADPEILNHMPIHWSLGSPFHPVVRLLLATLYIYTNFSGYFDMICGVSKMMGFELPINIKFPFLSRSMVEYWQHWHISLGAWFKNNFYLPISFYLASLKIGSISSTMISVFITFLLIGFWHGMNDKYIVWAIINALLVVCITFGSRNYLLGTPLTFCFVLLINGIFLSDSINSFYFFLSHFSEIFLHKMRWYDFKFIIIFFVTLFILYGLEKIFYVFPVSPRFSHIIVRFILSLLLISFGFIFTDKGDDFIYTGF